MLRTIAERLSRRVVLKRSPHDTIRAATALRNSEGKVRPRVRKTRTSFNTLAAPEWLGRNRAGRILEV